MSLVRKVKKEEVKNFVKSLKKKIKKENPKKNLYSSVYPVRDFSKIFDAKEIATGEIGAKIKEGFFPFGKTIIDITIPSEINVDFNLYPLLEKEVYRFSRKYNLPHFYIIDDKEQIIF